MQVSELQWQINGGRAMLTINQRVKHISGILGYVINFDDDNAAIQLLTVDNVKCNLALRCSPEELTEIPDNVIPGNLLWWGNCAYLDIFVLNLTGKII